MELHRVVEVPRLRVRRRDLDVGVVADDGAQQSMVADVDLVDDGQAWDLGEQHGGGDFVHAHRIARDLVLQAVHHLRIEAVVLLPEFFVGTGVQDSFCGTLVVVGHEDTALAGAHPLAGLGGETPDVAEGAERSPAPRRAVRVSAVFDEEEVVLLDDLHHRVHVGHVAAHVGHQEDLRAGFGHFAVEVFGVHAPLAVRFDQHGFSTGVVDHAWHGVEGERVGQDLVAGFHAGDVERDVHRRATGIGADGVLHAHVLGEGLLEARRERVFLGRWLVAVHDAASHGVGRHGNAFLWNGLERLVVEVDDALAAFDNEASTFVGHHALGISVGVFNQPPFSITLVGTSFPTSAAMNAW